MEQMRNGSVFWATHVRDAASVTTLEPDLASIFSYFKYKETCPGKKQPTFVYSYIEPLAGPMRHPGSVCNDNRSQFTISKYVTCFYAYLSSRCAPSSSPSKQSLYTSTQPMSICREYLVLPTLASPELAGLRNDRRAHQAIVVDLGASEFAKGEGGPSQEYFYNQLKRRGIDVDRMLLWELSPHSMKELLADVPEDLFHAYQVPSLIHTRTFL